jgi:hypothetical protein
MADIAKPAAPGWLDRIAQPSPGLVGSAVSLYKGIYEYNRPNINYDILNLQADAKDIQAEQQLARATQESNLLRKQFNQAAGAYTYGAARRNVKTGEGSAAENVEMSARDLGEDVYTLRRNADFQAQQLRGEAEMLRQGAESSNEIHEWERIGALASGIGDSAAQFKTGWDIIDSHNKQAAAAREYDERYGLGNIDLHDRPVVNNEDGSISTVRSMSFSDNGQEILVPTVVNGRLLSSDDAIAEYHKTGKYLGKFKTIKEANNYAERLHKKQQKYYKGDK